MINNAEVFKKNLFSSKINKIHLLGALKSTGNIKLIRKSVNATGSHPFVNKYVYGNVNPKSVNDIRVLHATKQVSLDQELNWLAISIYTS